MDWISNIFRGGGQTKSATVRFFPGSAPEHDVNLKLKIFNDIFHSVLEVHAPIKIVKIRSRSCPYITREIKDLMRDRDRLHRHFLQTRDNSDWNYYKEYRKKVKITLRTLLQLTHLTKYRNISTS